MRYNGDPGDGSPRASEPVRGWRSEKAGVGFWVLAVIGVPVLCFAWFWYGLAGLEEMTDMESPSGAQTSTLVSLGAIPVIFIHGVLLLLLIWIGVTFHRRMGVGVLLAFGAVALASGVGIAVNQALTAGCLFAMSAEQMCPVYVP